MADLTYSHKNDFFNIFRTKDKFSKASRSIDNLLKRSELTLQKLQKRLCYDLLQINYKVGKEKIYENIDITTNINDDNMLSKTNRVNFNEKYRKKNMETLDKLANTSLQLELPKITKYNKSQNEARLYFPHFYTTNRSEENNKYLTLATSSNDDNIWSDLWITKTSAISERTKPVKEKIKKNKKTIIRHTIRDDRGYYPNYNAIEKKIKTVFFGRPKYDNNLKKDLINDHKIKSSIPKVNMSNISIQNKSKMIKGIKFENYSDRRDIVDKKKGTVLTYLNEDTFKISNNLRKTIDFKRISSRSPTDMIKNANIPAPAYYIPNYSLVHTSNKTLVNYKKRNAPGKKFYLSKQFYFSNK